MKKSACDLVKELTTVRRTHGAMRKILAATKDYEVLEQAYFILTCRKNKVPNAKNITIDEILTRMLAIRPDPIGTRTLGDSLMFDICTESGRNSAMTWYCENLHDPSIEFIRKVCKKGTTQAIAGLVKSHWDRLQDIWSQLDLVEVCMLFVCFYRKKNYQSKKYWRLRNERPWINAFKHCRMNPLPEHWAASPELWEMQGEKVKMVLGWCKDHIAFNLYKHVYTTYVHHYPGHCYSQAWINISFHPGSALDVAIDRFLPTIAYASPQTFGPHIYGVATFARDIKSIIKNYCNEDTHKFVLVQLMKLYIWNSRGVFADERTRVVFTSYQMLDDALAQARPYLFRTYVGMIEFVTRKRPLQEEQEWAPAQREGMNRDVWGKVVTYL